MKTCRLILVTLLVLGMSTGLALAVSETAAGYQQNGSAPTQGAPGFAPPSCSQGGGCLFFNGEANNVNGLSNEYNTLVSDGDTWDNVTNTTDWTVKDIVSDDLVTDSTKFSSGVWGIRTGVSEGNGGTLVASGTAGGSNFTITLFRQPPPGLEEIFADCGGVPNVPIASGTKAWYDCAPSDHGSERSFEATTSFDGQFGSGIHTGNDSFFNSFFFEENFAPGSQFVGTPADFSFAVGGSQGTTGVPEPASLMLLGTGLVGPATRLRRQRK